MSRGRQEWDLHFLKLAQTVSEMSKDPSTKVGAVIVDKNKYIVSTGYNGFPKCIEDNHRLDNREVKYDIIIHAELNAILTAGRQGKSVEGCTIYTWPLPPCVKCASTIIQAGITRAVSFYPENDRWLDSCKAGDKLMEEAGMNPSTWYSYKK